MKAMKAMNIIQMKDGWVRLDKDEMAKGKW